jgi:protein-tyrosine-phosphatase/DNA-binding transcriptional ArsR family regulator
MELSDIFAMLGDRQRLRIVNLLSDGPLCVSHLQTVVGATQVAVSKKLAQLREQGLVECRKDQNWVVYSIPRDLSDQTRTILDAVRSCAENEPIYLNDRKKLREIMPDDRAPIEVSVIRDYGDDLKFDRRRKVLFLCTGNTASSIFAEFLLRHLANDRFEAFSAGANPTGKVDSMTLSILADSFGIEANIARSKSLDEFRRKHVDFVITLCDRALEACPAWLGQPITAHWSSSDPAECSNQERRLRAFFNVAMVIHHRVRLFSNLPIPKLNHSRLQQATRWIGTQPTSPVTGSDAR